VSAPTTRPPRRAGATGPGGRVRPEPASGSRTRLTVADFCAEMEISRRTFHEWRAKGRAPRCLKLPNGDLRITRTAFEEWLATCEEAAR
jgi:hypothetical protein